MSRSIGNPFFRYWWILLFVAFVLFISSVYQVDQRQWALVIRFGEIIKTENQPGLYFRVPFVDTVEKVDNRIQVMEGFDMLVQVKDGRRYLVDTVTTYRVQDPIQFKVSVNADLKRSERRLNTQLDSALRSVYGDSTFEDALSEKRRLMMENITSIIQPEAKKIGLQLVEVRIRRTDLSRQVLARTYERMGNERKKEADQIRAAGNEAQLRIRATADKEAAILVANAKRDSEIIKGKADAKRLALFAAAYSADVDFYAFFQAMSSYSIALGEGDTYMVLSPESDYLRFLKSFNGLKYTSLQK